MSPALPVTQALAIAHFRRPFGEFDFRSLVTTLFVYRLDDALMTEIESGLSARRTKHNLQS